MAFFNSGIIASAVFWVLSPAIVSAQPLGGPGFRFVVSGKNVPPALIEPATIIEKDLTSTEPVAHHPACAGKLGTYRTVVIDTTGGPHYGSINRYKEADFLANREVVLTFDDGPNPRATGAVLDTLKEHCVKATFFVVGRMAKYYPKLLKRIADEGHTIAGHTVSHPMPFSKLTTAKAKQEIENGFKQIEEALGEPASPFFRFPGLQDRKEFRDYLSRRNITALSVDVIGGDTRAGANPQKIIQNIMSGARRKDGGILLMHDPLKRTARALPEILRQLRDEGFRVVHMRAAYPYEPPVAPLPSDSTTVSKQLVEKADANADLVKEKKSHDGLVDNPTWPAVY
jgi:peptidoglycan/xylan/chitin deacetylase (PgdA/CDA1 family)